MSQRIEIDSGRTAVAIATAILDCVIVGPIYKPDFRIQEINDHPERDSYYEVAAFDWTGDKRYVIAVDAYSGGVIERKEIK